MPGIPTRRRRATPPSSGADVGDRVSGLAAVGRGCRRISGLSFPAGYPLVQFPNPPLIVSLVAAAVGGWLSGDAARAARAVSTVALVAWAYDELAHGVNAFRRLLGLTFLAIAAAGIARSMAH
jgi:hypothetical protein